MRALIKPASTRRSGNRDPESGYTAIEFVIWTPLLMILIMIAVQTAMYLFAEHVAQTAAQAGARVVREEKAGSPIPVWQNDATLAADNWVGNLIGSGAGKPSVGFTDEPPPVGECAPIVGVTVTFTMSTLLGGVGVSATNEGPEEQYYPAGC